MMSRRDDLSDHKVKQRRKSRGRKFDIEGAIMNEDRDHSDDDLL
jgi:hypothetical protein